MGISLFCVYLLNYVIKKLSRIKCCCTRDSRNFCQWLFPNLYSEIMVSYRNMIAWHYTEAERTARNVKPETRYISIKTIMTNSSSICVYVKYNNYVALNGMSSIQASRVLVWHITINVNLIQVGKSQPYPSWQEPVSTNYLIARYKIAIKEFDFNSLSLRVPNQVSIFTLTVFVSGPVHAHFYHLSYESCFFCPSLQAGPKILILFDNQCHDARGTNTYKIPICVSILYFSL